MGIIIPDFTSYSKAELKLITWRREKKDKELEKYQDDFLKYLDSTYLKSQGYKYLYEWLDSLTKEQVQQMTFKTWQKIKLAESFEQEDIKLLSRITL